MKHLYCLLLTVICLLSTSSLAADLNVIPEAVDTGFTNITTAFTISSTNSFPVSWTAISDFGINPDNWFVLGVTNGSVNSNFDSVPVTIRRDRIPILGSFTGSIYITGGDIARTVTVVTAIGSLTNNNGMFPRINGDDHAYAGIPYKLNAEGSLGWSSNYFWVVNYDPSQPVSNQAFSTQLSGETIFNEPGEIDLSLVSRDPHGRESVNSIHKFDILNSPPSILLSSPHINLNNNSVTIVAHGSDPNPTEILEYRWKFEQGGSWTEWNSSSTGTHTYASSYDGLVWCEVRDTWTNNSLKAQGIVEVSMAITNTPSVLIAYSNDVWSSYAQHHDVTLQAYSTNFAIKALPTNAGSVEWRERPGNPLSGLIPENVITNYEIFLTGLTNPGVYAFMVVGSSSNQISGEAGITITVPGVIGHVVADGFQAPVPVWGAHSSVNPANTNAFGWPDETENTRSDLNGTFFLDRPANAQCFVELERTRAESEFREYNFSTVYSSNYNGHQTFYFPVTNYAYGGRLVDNADHSRGIPYVSATLLINSIRLPNVCNLAGCYSFGNLPKAWPIDNESGSYYVVFHKDGWNSFCLKLPPNKVNFGVIDDLWSLEKTNATITLNGFVKSSKSFLPVAGAIVWFGDRKAVADENGRFEFASLPKPFHPFPSWPTHVLIAEASGYTPTRNLITAENGGDDIQVLIDGGETYLYGSIFDGINGTIVTNGTITTPTGNLTSNMKDGKILSAVPASTDISKSGFFSIKVPGGCDYVTIEVDGLVQEIPVNREQTGSQPVRNDIEFIPEPSMFLLFLLPLFVRKNILFNKIRG